MSKHQPFTNAWFARISMALAVLLSVALATPSVSPTVAAQGTELAQAIVLVNSNSAAFTDFEDYIQPYLDHFGVPYTVLDIGTADVTASIGEYALIIIGHRELDLSNTYLDATEEGHITNAVTVEGSGLVNFDRNITNGTAPLYSFVNNLFHFTYKTPVIDYPIMFPPMEGDLGIVIDCTDDAHQFPVLTTDATATWVTDINTADDQWTEMNLNPRPVSALMAGIGETLPVMRCYTEGLDNGEYEVFANLYTGSFGEDLTYYYGNTEANPAASSVDTTGRSGGEDQFDEYSLGTVNIADGTFNIYFNNADARSVAATAEAQEALTTLYAQNPHATVADPAYFGWSSIRLVKVGTPEPTMHWIGELHDPQDWIGTTGMTMSGINSVSGESTIVANSRLEPLLVATPAGQGRAVHWGSYDWMLYSIKGPLYGIDDLVWRSFVWAARKPFVMQGLPPFVTMRVTEVEDPMDWLETATGADFKPWLGVFSELIVPNASALATLTNADMATVGVFAKNRNVLTTGGFYYDHDDGELADLTVEGNFSAASAWFQSNNITPSSYVLPALYEFGTNVFDEMQAWGVESVGTVIEPGTAYPLTTPATPWLNLAPFRLYQDGDSNSGHPLTYSDFLTIPGHTELNNTFFNCITEIRDDAGFEWYPNDDVAGSIGRGTRQLQRALNAMTVASLNTTEPSLNTLVVGNLLDILTGINANLASYNVEYVTMDHACAYARAMFTSDITMATYNPSQQTITVDLAGNTDIPTRFYVFTDQGTNIQHTMETVPPFTDSTQVIVSLTPGQNLQYFLPIVIRSYQPQR